MFTAIVVFLLTTGEEFAIKWSGEPFPTIEACEAQFEKDKASLEAQMGVPVLRHVCVPLGEET